MLGEGELAFHFSPIALSIPGKSMCSVCFEYAEFSLSYNLSSLLFISWQQVMHGVVQRMVLFRFISDRAESSRCVYLPFFLNMQRFSYGIYLTYVFIPFSIAASNALLGAPKTSVCSLELRASISVNRNDIMLLMRAKMYVCCYVLRCT